MQLTSRRRSLRCCNELIKWVPLLLATSLPHMALSADTSGSGDSLAADMGVADAADLAFHQDEIPVVLTAARLKQPRSEVPASVTIIDSNMIEELGIRDLQDVFRLVPGMTVGYAQSNVPVVSYHGTNGEEQRRLQVLVDGRSVYNPNLASVDWLNIPVNLEDIDRIEINRGPNAAAYGANAFLAVVNIITKHPYDTHGARLKYQSGSTGYRRFYAAVGGGVDDLNYRLSLGGRQSNGFDRRAQKADGSPGDDFHDGYDFDTESLSTSWQASAQDNLDFQIGQSQGSKQNQPSDLQGSNPDTDTRDQYVSLKWTHDINENHSFHVLTYGQTRRRLTDWTSCVHPIAFSQNLYQLYGHNSHYVEALLSDPNVQAALISGHSPGLGTPADDALALAALIEYQTLDAQYKSQYGKAEICATANENIDEGRYEIELQDTLRFNDQLRLVSGTSLRKDEYTSETFFGGSGSNYLARLFGNLEYRPWQRLMFNLGGMYENDRNSGTALSPRFSAHYHLTPHQTLRLVLSKGIRTPDTYEQSVNWSYTGHDLTPPFNGQTDAKTFYNTQSPGGLDNEKIVSRELGYYLNLAEVGFELDLKWFHDSLYDLISAPLQIGSFEPENNLKLTQQGAEVEATYKPWTSDDLRLTYAYLDQDSEYTGTKDFSSSSGYFSELRLFQIESRLSAQNSGSAAWIHRWGYGITHSLVYYIADQLGEFDYGRIDARLAKRFQFGPSAVDIALLLEHYTNHNPIMFRDNVYDDRNHVFVSADVRF